MTRRRLARWVARLAGVALLLAASPSARAAASADLFAEQLDATNLDRRVAGEDADAGVGDFAFGNGTICGAVSAADHEGQLSMQGGTLVDLGLCDGGGDQWSALQPLFNLSPSWQIPIVSIETQADGAGAEVAVLAEGDGMRVSTHYRVEPEPARVLHVEQRLTRTGEGRRAFAVGMVALHSSGQMSPFTLSLAHPEATIGFEHPPVDHGSILQLVRAIQNADAHVLVGSDSAAVPLAVGVRLLRAERERADATRDAVPVIAINGEDFTLFGAMADTPWIGAGDPTALITLAQMPLMDLSLGETLTLEIELRVGERADVASVLDAWWPEAPLVSGVVDDPAARLAIATTDGRPVTWVAPDARGQFAFRAPIGAYRARIRAPGDRLVERDFEVGPGGAELGRISVGAPAVLMLPHGDWMRLVLRGEGDTPDPILGADLRDVRVGGHRIRASTEAAAVSLGGLSSDPDRVILAPGRYVVWATRGPEYELSQAHVELAPGQVLPLAIEPPARAFETPGFVASDLHMHSAYSFDSAFPLAEQLRAFAANGIEVTVSTEHDRVVDPRDAIAVLGLGDRIAGVSGVEVTTTVNGGESPFTIAHSNAFPLGQQRDAYRGGAPRAEGRRLRDVIHDVRDRAGLLQLNHPRANPGASNPDQYYLDHLAVAGEPFDPGLALDAAPNRVLLEPAPGHATRDVDFDAIELMNGSESDRYRRVRADWWSLWLQGLRPTGTANSDSHGAGEVPGMPRNWVRSADPAAASLGVVGPKGYDPPEWIDSVKSGHLVGTTGPWLDVRLGEAGVGDTWRGTQGTLRVRLRAADWVPVSTLRVLVNGDVAEERPVSGNADLEISLAFDADAFVVVEAEGEAGGAYATVLPGFTPLAFTNPISVDADGDGQITPPGLPDPLPWAIRVGREP